MILAASVVAFVHLGEEPNPAGLTLNVFPGELRGDAIAGQSVVYLVTVADGVSGREVGLTASAGGLPVSVYPEMVRPGDVAEVTVIPSVETVGSNVTVVIGAESGGSTVQQKEKFTVVPGEDTLSDRARQLREVFVDWLQLNHPELGITNQTVWSDTIVSPRWLVVSHYLFFSRDWEMHVYWHVMIPPYDWARIDLRHRTTELAPSLSFEIPSLNGSLPPQPIAPPESAWR